MKRKEFILAGLLLLNGCASSRVSQWIPKISFAKKTSVHKKYFVRSCKPIWISLNDARAELMQTCQTSYRGEMAIGLASSAAEYNPR